LRVACTVAPIDLRPCLRTLPIDLPIDLRPGLRGGLRDLRPDLRTLPVDLHGDARWPAQVCPLAGLRAAHWLHTGICSRLP